METAQLCLKFSKFLLSFKTLSKGNMNLTAGYMSSFGLSNISAKKESSIQKVQLQTEKILKIQLNCRIMSEFMKDFFFGFPEKILWERKIGHWNTKIYQNIFILIKFWPFKLLWNRSVEKPLDMLTLFILFGKSRYYRD